MATALTTTSALAPEFPAAYYKTQALKELKKKYLFYQFAQKQPLPKHNGKNVQFRIVQYYAASTTPLVEGTPPAGLDPAVDEVLIGIQQFGDWTGISDLASFVAVDNLVALEVDKLTRLQHEKIELLNVAKLKLASNVIYAANGSGVVPASADALTAAHAVTSLELRKAVRDLKKNNAQPYYRNGKPYYICIVNPDSTYALQNDTTWKDVSKYQDSEKIENGEIGKLFGCIVVESPFPISWLGANLTAAARNLTVASSSGKVITVDEAISAAEATALAARKIILNGAVYTVVSSATGAAGAATVTVAETITSGDAVDGIVMYPGEGGAAGVEIQGAMVFGQWAYGNVELEGERNLSVYAEESGGPTDPLHQLRTVGVKIAGFGAGILNQDELVMIKHGVVA